MSGPALRKLTEDEYLNTDDLGPFKREYVNGFVYAQAGATNAHNDITSNMHISIGTAAKRKGCRVQQGDMRVRIVRIDGTKYYFPDLVVRCQKLENKALCVSEPCLIVEVLSTGTRQIDMTYKAEDYLSIPSLQGYLLVDSESRAAELYRKTPSGWQVEGVQGGVELPCVGVSLSLDEMYDGVTF